MKQSKSGVCKLTGAQGKFVKSHLIPKALTKPAIEGGHLIQSGHGRRPTRRWSSWYDCSLVVQAGEDILSALDTWAITELRRHKLVWSGWSKGDPALSAHEHKLIPGTTWGIRQIEGLDPRRLRLFLLSLLWRAAASDLHEFSEIVLSAEELEQLRSMIVTGSPDPLSFYPVQLIQLSTLGPIHNLAPLAQTKVLPGFGDQPERTVPIYRSYLDGLIAHMHRPSPNDFHPDGLGPLNVGGESRLTVSTVTYEESFQHVNLDAVRGAAHEAWPDIMARLEPVDAPPLPGLPRPAGSKITRGT